MAINSRFSMPFETVFPNGLFQVTEVEQVLDFERSSKDHKVQQFDKETGLPLWQMTCLDADPDAKKAQKTVTVKFATKHQPVPPENKSDSPFTPIELDGLTALPWVEQVSKDFSRLSWSFRAEAIREPGASKKPSGGSSASGSASASSGSASSGSSSTAA